MSILKTILEKNRVSYPTDSSPTSAGGAPSSVADPPPRAAGGSPTADTDMVDLDQAAVVDLVDLPPVLVGDQGGGQTSKFGPGERSNSGISPGGDGFERGDQVVGRWRSTRFEPHPLATPPPYLARTVAHHVGGSIRPAG